MALPDKEETAEIRVKMHPWNGKTREQRKAYIEKLLIEFKTNQISKETQIRLRQLETIGGSSLDMDNDKAINIT